MRSAGSYAGSTGLIPSLIHCSACRRLLYGAVSTLNFGENGIFSPQRTHYREEERGGLRLEKSGKPDRAGEYLYSSENVAATQNVALGAPEAPHILWNVGIIPPRSPPHARATQSHCLPRCPRAPLRSGRIPDQPRRSARDREHARTLP